ncbi:MAG: acetamidase/formamidase family protein [Acidobacteria bacterium]|nr:acetamidase/formamidase family protein [Acidobacteriota bacterium]MYH27988.1 acetamidase/formamidase family protein [Acidobacteriota bacterium]MYK87514.1 acetamidase/formamidase family protein [Acidobacteriota bacterium]
MLRHARRIVPGLRCVARGSLCAAVLLFGPTAAPAQDDIVVVGGEGRHCGEDPQCMNRLHPAIPMAARARPGQTIVFRARNASDFDLDPESTYEDPRAGDSQIGTVHPLTGPVHIEGAEPGDVLAVTLLDIAPGLFGYTSVSPIGFVSDHVTGSFRAEWRLNRIEAVSDDLPGVRIPNASFPGIVTVLPGPDELAAVLSREAELRAVGGAGFPPYTTHASPAAVCGPDGSHPDECLRTLPPREHGGNLDIRYLQVGVTLYLPCYVAGCGLAIGDPHFAQGDGEVSGTAIEMDADFTLTTRLIKDGPELRRGPHFEGPVRVLDIPSRRFYATTGFPLKAAGEVPPDMRYLGASERIGALRNLSKDVSLAARNALLEMIDYMTETYGLTQEQAYVVASVAVDLRIGQLVDAPNVGVTALLPLDIFTGR